MRLRKFNESIDNVELVKDCFVELIDKNTKISVEEKNDNRGSTYIKIDIPTDNLFIDYGNSQSGGGVYDTLEEIDTIKKLNEIALDLEYGLEKLGNRFTSKVRFSTINIQIYIQTKEE